MLFGYIAIVILHITNINSKDKYYQFPFTIGQKSTSFTEMVKTTLKTDVCFGTPSQCQIIEFDSNTYMMYVLNSSSPNVTFDNPYNSFKSSSFVLQDTQELNFRKQAVKKGFISSDIIKADNFELNATMVLGTDIQVLNCRGAIGLQKEGSETQVPSLLTQLEKQKKIYELEIGIEFSSSTSGVITFGGAPQNTPLLFQTSFSTETLFPAYIITGSKVIIDPKSKKPQNGLFNLDVTYSYIEAPFRAMNVITKTYRLRDSMCQEIKERFDKEIKSISRIYYYYICSKEFVEKYIGTYHDFVVQFNREGSDLLILDKKDLFTEYNSTHKLFTLIIKDGDSDSYDWKLGHSILRNYKLVYNIEDMIIKFYSNDKVNENSSVVLVIISLLLFASFSMIIIIRSNIIKAKHKLSGLLNKHIDFAYPMI